MIGKRYPDPRLQRGINEIRSYNANKAKQLQACLTNTLNKGGALYHIAQDIKNTLTQLRDNKRPFTSLSHK